MPKKRTYPKSAEAFNAFIRKHGLEDLSKLEERLEVGKGYLRYYVSKGTARLREISMFRLSALAGISGIDLLHDILKYPPNDINFDPPRGGVVRYFYNDEKVEDHGFRCSSQRRFQNHDYQRMPSSCAATCS